MEFCEITAGEKMRTTITTRRVFVKGKKRRKTERLGPMERKVLAAVPDTDAVNAMLDASRIASAVKLTRKQTYGALRRLLEKGHVFYCQPWGAGLWTVWTRKSPFAKEPRKKHRRGKA
jgi:hypothetical protein